MLTIRDIYVKFLPVVDSEILKKEGANLAEYGVYTYV